MENRNVLQSVQLYSVFDFLPTDGAVVHFEGAVIAQLMTTHEGCVLLVGAADFTKVVFIRDGFSAVSSCDGSWVTLRLCRLF